MASWAPDAWRTMHAMAFSYPSDPTPDDARDMYKFLRYFGRVLPCKACRRHYERWFSATMPSHRCAHLKDRRAISEWTVALHNSVNARTGKIEVPYEQVAEAYGQRDEMCSVKPPQPRVPGTPSRGVWTVFGAVALLVTLVVALIVAAAHRSIHRTARRARPDRMLASSIAAAPPAARCFSPV